MRNILFFTVKHFVSCCETLVEFCSEFHVKKRWEGKMKTALTIAGTDSSGGAGIQADIKTMTANGVYAMSAVTALTAQNTNGVSAVMEVSADFLENQIATTVTDIFPDAAKTGMVSNPALVEVISDCVKKFALKNLVVDPVMVATSGARLITDDAIETLKKRLLPLALVITPNIPEAEVLCGTKIQSETQMEEAAQKIFEEYGCAVLVKGGHFLDGANDFLFSWNEEEKRAQKKWFYGKRIENPNTHGTGCTLSAAICANLAKDFSLEESISRAKEYLSGALGAMLDLGRGRGPLNHAFAIKSE